MSWNFKVIAKAKEDAKAAIAASKEVAEWKYCPAGVVNAINAAIDALPDSKEFGIQVNTHGHVDLNEHGHPADKSGANFTITASMVELPKEEEVKVEEGKADTETA